MNYPKTLYVRKENSGLVEASSNNPDNAYYCTNSTLEQVVPLDREVVVGVYELVETKRVKAEVVINDKN